MTREEAINKVRQMNLPKETKEILEALAPELRESEDEKIRKELLKEIEFISPRDGETDSEGLILPSYHARIDRYRFYLEKQKESLPISETCKENANSFADGIIEVRSFQRGLEEGKRLEKQKEQKPAEYLSKDKVYAIMSKLTKLSTSNLIPFNSPEYKKINEITSDIRSLLDYPIEQKPRWEINNPHTTKWTKEMIDEKFEELVEEYHKQKPVVTHGETYHVDTLGTQQVIAGKMPQKPAEWSEEDEEMLNSCICSIEESKENRYAYKETDGDTSYDHEIAWLKSLRPQPKDEIYKEKDNAFKLGKHQLAIQFMNYLDENRPEGKMSLSNGECEDIDKAFKENDWAKILRYAEKYGK